MSTNTNNRGARVLRGGIMLVDKNTGIEIKIGDTVTTFRGDKVTVTDIADLVYVTHSNGITKSGYYMSVINAKYCNDKQLEDV